MPKLQQPDLSRIPLCQSDFLQDLSIELGLRLKSIRQRAGRIEFKVTTTEFEGDEWECFDATRWLSEDSYIQLVVLENRRANYVMRLPAESEDDMGRYTGFIVDFNDWSASEIANLLRDSLNNELGVQAIWQKIDIRKKPLR